MIKRLTANARNPQGIWGNLMIKKMNRGHADMTAWALTRLHIKSDATVLDIGCGGGNAVYMLSKKVKNGKVFGIDYSALSVEKSIQKNKKAVHDGRVKILEAGVSSLPFKDLAIDAATAIETIYFWPDLSNDFKEIYRVLNTGGTFCVVCEMVKNSDGSGVHTEIAEFLKLHYLKQEEITALFSSAGFKEISAVYNKENGWLMVTGMK